MSGPRIRDANCTYEQRARRQWYINRSWIVLLLITSCTSGYADSLMNALQMLPQWNQAFGFPTGGKLGVLNAVQYVGTLVGHLCAPYICDRMSPRCTIFLASITVIVATGIQIGAQSIGMFIGARCLVGFGVAFSTNTAPVLIAELVYPAYRTSMTSIYHSLWYTGAIFAAWTTFGSLTFKSSLAWRIPSALQAVSSILHMFFVLSVPESPRWLVSKGKDPQALKTLARYYAGGNENDALVKDEFEGIKAECRDTPDDGWTSLFSTPGNRKRLRIIIAIAIFSQCSGNGMVSYYLSKMLDTVGITDPAIQLIINGSLQIWNLFWALLASSLAERLNRRLMFISSACGMLMFFTSQTICSSLFAQHGSRPVAHAAVVSLFLFSAFYDIAFTPLIMTYTIEILPEHSRAQNFNIFNLTIHIGLILNKYVNPIALDRWRWRCYIIYVCWLSFEVVFLYFVVVETKGMKPEQIAAQFDDPHDTSPEPRQQEPLI